jgi:hypothetical protein
VKKCFGVGPLNRSCSIVSLFLAGVAKTQVMVAMGKSETKHGGLSHFVREVLQLASSVFF